MGQMYYKTSSGALVPITGATNDPTKVSLTGTETISGDKTFSGALVPSSPFSNRNKIINGAFAVDQRNSGASQTFTAGGVLAYTVDRWYAYCTGANITGQRVAGSAPFQYYYRFTGAASNTAVGFGTRLEAADTYHLAGKTATLSVYAASSSLTSLTWTAYYANTTDAFGTLAQRTSQLIATGTFTLTGTVSQKTAQISVPVAATTGIEIVFSGGALLGSQTLTFAGAQLELGSSATPFEFEPSGSTLQKCQRYYETTFNYVDGWIPKTDLSGTAVVNAGGFGSSNATATPEMPLKYSRKRVLPTIKIYAPLNNPSTDKVRKASDGTTFSVGGTSIGLQEAAIAITSATANVSYQYGMTVEAEL